MVGFLILTDRTESKSEVLSWVSHHQLLTLSGAEWRSASHLAGEGTLRTPSFCHSLVFLSCSDELLASCFHLKGLGLGKLEARRWQSKIAVGPSLGHGFNSD